MGGVCVQCFVPLALVTALLCDLGLQVLGSLQHKTRNAVCNARVFPTEVTCVCVRMCAYVCVCVRMRAYACVCAPRLLLVARLLEARCTLARDVSAAWVGPAADDV